MHDLVLTPLKKFVKAHSYDLEYLPSADLGGRNENGCVKDLVPFAISFDIVPANGVNVIIERGVIPKKYRHRFPYVFATSTINFCESENEFFVELGDLCLERALIFITGCTNKCPYGHDKEDYKLHRKYTIEDVVKKFSRFYDIEVNDLGTDFIVIGKRKIFKRTDILKRIIEARKYSSYLEIGVRYPNENYDHINIKRKVGVDPNVDYPGVVKTTSDDFFAKNTEKFDLIFVDGDHRENQVRRDVDNALASLNPGGTIVMHDCLPEKEEHQGDIQRSSIWNGSSWKILLEMRKRYGVYTKTVDVDYGCGIIRLGQQDPPMAFGNISWEEFDRRRDELAGVISYDKFYIDEEVKP